MLNLIIKPTKMSELNFLEIQTALKTNFSDDLNYKIMQHHYANKQIKKLKITPFDEFFTKQSVADDLTKKTIDVLRKFKLNLKKFIFIEPSAGSGSFLNSLQNYKNKVKEIIAYDIFSKNPCIIKENFFKVNLPQKNFIVIGNPPFGHRGNLALKFINHSKNADFIAFILPMTFANVGKGSCRTRINSHNLMYSETLSKNIFYTNDKISYSVQCVFQIWAKHFNLPQEDKWNVNNYIDIYTICTNKNRRCGLAMINNCDFYISSTFFKSIKIENNFSKIKYNSGIGVVIKQNKREIFELFQKENWLLNSNLATNFCRHIGKIHIKNVLKRNGYFEKE